MEALAVLEQPLGKAITPEVRHCAAPPSPTYPAPQDQPVVDIAYADLVHGDAQKVHALLNEAFGPGGLGLVIISGLPDVYKSLRKRLLDLGHQFMCQPVEAKRHLEDPVSSYSVGWSYGREQLADRQYDKYKESFYYDLNAGSPPLTLLRSALQGTDVAGGTASGTADGGCTACTAAGGDGSTAVPPELAECYPAYYRSTRWPEAELPDLKPTALEAACLIRDVGILLARLMDRFVRSHGGQSVGHGHAHLLEGQILRSRAHKARLLGYHPHSRGRDVTPGDRVWCTEHTDHGALTGLMPAMYFRQDDGSPAPCPDPSAGLYVRRQDGREVHVSIPADCLAFQVGEAAQVMSGDLLQATPHYVMAPAGGTSCSAMRVTLAVFLQPDVPEVMDPPEGLSSHVKGWMPGMTFGDFANTRFAQYYPEVAQPNANQ